MVVYFSLFPSSRTLLNEAHANSVMLRWTAVSDHAVFYFLTQTEIDLTP